METQILGSPVATCSYIVAPFKANSAPQRPICASSRDYGFDFDDEELGRELLDPLPASLTNREMAEINPGEFESLFLWFIS